MSRGPGGASPFGSPPRSKLVGHLSVLALLAGIAAVAAWGHYAPPPPSAPPDRAALGQGDFAAEREPVTLTLYFADEDATRLLPEIREVARDRAVPLPFQAMVELARGPSPGSDLFATVPPGARVTRVELAGEVATVDWSRAFVDEHWGGSAGEWLTIQSIVKTMRQFEGVERIQLLVEGKAIETLAGHFEADHPFPPEGFETGDGGADEPTGAVGAAGSAGATDAPRRSAAP